MTRRPYYTDSYTRTFQAQVLETADGEDAPAVVLDQTFFYPTSGGQPHDTGTLGPARVVQVSVREQDDAVVHLLDAPLPPGPVSGTIDWPRRFDHMQQHTGQHILSQAFLREAASPTIGFHLGREAVSIDLDIASLSDAAVAEAESLANDVVSSNLPVRGWFPSEEELSHLALRKTPEVRGAFRVVGIGDFDYSACGGTHVAATGEVGLIAVHRIERLKRGIRVEFLCGSRARRDYAEKHALLRELGTTLTCSPGEVPGSVTRLLSALTETRRQLDAAVERELELEAARRLDSALRVGSIRIVAGGWDARPIDQVKDLALRLTTLPGVVALLGVAGPRAQLVFARSADLELDLKPLFERTLATLGGGRGGGTRILQGAAAAASLAQVESALIAAAGEVKEPTT